jgi:hypothetical protein
VPPTTTTTTQPCNLLTTLLGCKPSSSSSTTTKSKSSSGGLAGLLSQSVTATQGAAQASALPATSSNTNTAIASNTAPSLTAPAAELLPPLPQSQNQSHHPHHTHRGLVSQWAHDVASWF